MKEVLIVAIYLLAPIAVMYIVPLPNWAFFRWIRIGLWILLGVVLVAGLLGNYGPMALTWIIEKAKLGCSNIASWIWSKIVGIF